MRRKRLRFRYLFDLEFTNWGPRSRGILRMLLNAIFGAAREN